MQKALKGWLPPKINKYVLDVFKAKTGLINRGENQKALRKTVLKNADNCDKFCTFIK